MCCQSPIRPALADQDQQRAAERAAGAHAQSLRAAVSPAVDRASDRERRSARAHFYQQHVANRRQATRGRRHVGFVRRRRANAIGDQRSADFPACAGRLAQRRARLAGRAQTLAQLAATGHAAPRFRVQCRDLRAPAADYIADRQKPCPTRRRRAVTGAPGRHRFAGGQGPEVTLLLNSVPGGTSAAYSFVAPPRPANANAVTVARPGVAAGEYFIRVQSDGAESPLDLDPASSNLDRSDFAMNRPPRCPGTKRIKPI